MFATYRSSQTMHFGHFLGLGFFDNLQHSTHFNTGVVIYHHNFSNFKYKKACSIIILVQLCNLLSNMYFS